MTRLNVVLLAALLASALYLVRQSYDARRLFTELDRAQSAARQLETEYERLKAERQAQATPLRVEKTAREKLQMRTATPAVTQYARSTTPAARCWPRARRPGAPSSWSR
ncbi:cell division protein FtsL [Piscinibacter sakaiensis]|uniref:cell division protein FtsL n=1 Tax=Piscinibacter sakaiensis TaxID=1547922 RepID=UPI0037275D30